VRVNRLRVGDLRLDPLTKEVFRGDEAIMLTQREFALLEFFMRNPGRAITRPEIARCVWNHDTPTAQEETNIVDVYVNYLRRKLDLGGPPILLTVRGTGYMLKAD
jgi:DNA-binding response OmpR family regulator